MKIDDEYFEKYVLTCRLFHAPLAYVNSLFFFKKPNKSDGYLVG